MVRFSSPYKEKVLLYFLVNLYDFSSPVEQKIKLQDIHTDFCHTMKLEGDFKEKKKINKIVQ